MSGDAELWDGLTEHIHSMMGLVGIPKMLGASSEDEAREKWLQRVTPFLADLREVVGVEAAGPARLRVDDALILQLGMHDFTLGVDEKPLIETSYFVDPAGAVLALVGWERWDDEWLDLLRGQGTPRPIRMNDSPFGPWQNLLWVAQNPPHPGRWLVGETPAHAEIGGLGEDLGFTVVSDIFRKRVVRTP
ncbi:hypothetical protein [Microbacterium aurantiacum]|uniref:Uncharacterized protein n=1 Tax=Microbacterium aurantiacum TaxID=162393 RepID=A0A0M8MPH2_9MICO|nr:hypothetical protein [Microbacterium chocolatum]ANG84393.1 hypothetical protein A8L33_02430 [Microbacterium chocolatum]KOS11674.1 hypothetical protein XI38_03775 [Microbacterium chocolatum]